MKNRASSCSRHRFSTYRVNFETFRIHILRIKYFFSWVFKVAKKIVRFGWCHLYQNVFQTNLSAKVGWTDLTWYKNAILNYIKLLNNNNDMKSEYGYKVCMLCLLSCQVVVFEQIWRLSCIKIRDPHVALSPTTILKELHVLRLGIHKWL